MLSKQREKWMELCELAANEQDANKMMTLITEINRLLAVKRQRLDTSNPNSLKCPKQCVANLWVG